MYCEPLFTGIPLSIGDVLPHEADTAPLPDVCFEILSSPADLFGKFTGAVGSDQGSGYGETVPEAVLCDMSAEVRLNEIVVAVTEVIVTGVVVLKSGKQSEIVILFPAIYECDPTVIVATLELIETPDIDNSDNFTALVAVVGSQLPMLSSKEESS